jgi:hypothetical protein
VISFYLDGCHCHFMSPREVYKLCQLSESHKAYELIRKIHGAPLWSLRRFIEDYLLIEVNYGAMDARIVLDQYTFADDGIRLKEERR